MAISRINQAAGSATSGTEIDAPSAGSLDVLAGDLVLCHATIVDTTGTVTFSKKFGTSTVGSFAPSITKTGSVAKSVVSWVRVTGNGTLQIAATSDATLTAGTLEWVVYRGASGIGQNTTATGSTGTDISATLTTQFASSWCAIAGHSEATTTDLTTGTGTSIEETVNADPTGTANDISGAIGSNETALTVGTVKTLHLTQPTGKTWAAIMVEIVLQFTVAGGARMAAAATNLASSVRAGSGTVSAASSRVASSVKAAAAGMAGVASEQVTANLAAATARAAASASEVASSVKAASGTSSAAASGQVTANLVSVAERMAAAAARVASSNKAIGAGSGASAFVIASSVVGKRGGFGATAVVVAGPEVPRSAWAASMRLAAVVAGGCTLRARVMPDLPVTVEVG